MDNAMKPTIWIVDDDKSIRWVMERALEKADMDVRCFEDAQSMLKRLGQDLPDTVISDIRMPGSAVWSSWRNCAGKIRACR